MQSIKSRAVIQDLIALLEKHNDPLTLINEQLCTVEEVNEWLKEYTKDVKYRNNCATFSLDKQGWELKLTLVRVVNDKPTWKFYMRKAGKCQTIIIRSRLIRGV